MNRLDLSATADNLVHLRDAVVVPPAGGPNARQRPSGVLDSGGRFVEQSISWNSSDSAVNTEPPAPDPDGIATLAGRYVFGGILYGHFGHLVVESFSRIWALDAVSRPIDGLVFTPKHERVGERIIDVYSALTTALGIDVPLLIAHRPTRVEELYVPRQGFGMHDLSEGSEAFRRFISNHAGRGIEPMGGDKLYISRSKLPPFRGSILGEARLERYLAAEGYDVFHPQSASQRDQIARYKAARQVISVDSSPLHLLGYVGDARQQVAILTRRSLEIASFIARQLIAFKGMKATEINVLVNEWIPQPGDRPGRSSYGEIDFPRLHGELLSRGLIADATIWPALKRQERDDELDRLTAVHKASFSPLHSDSGLGA